MSTSLANAGLLKISGIDAKKFLQGQLTCHLDEVIDTKARLAAHCNPQGRIISLFHIFRQNDDYYLLMRREMIPIAMAALKKYAVFYKVTLIEESLGKTPIPTITTPSFPAIYPETSGKFLPHELNLHLFNAISFDKGCYTGQEIIARMHYRGKLKTHLYQATVVSQLKPKPGTDVYYQTDGTILEGGTIIDSSAEMTDNHYTVWLVCDEEHVKNEHLFIDQETQYYLTFREQAE